MPLHKFSENAVLNTLIELFRQHGYDGASLSRIMGATGLVKASLYHRFAGGKEDMAAAVIDRVAQTFAKSVLAPLAEPGDPTERLQETGKRLLKFYGSGVNPCLLDTLTLNRENSAVRARARSTLQYWVNAFTKFAKECGLPSDIARQRAEDAVAAIEGGLILARVSQNRRPFLRAIEDLHDRLMR
jgi:TetR/AcrR family transcriptional regulator, lmrAB and yxaGH operons repressor